MPSSSSVQVVSKYTVFPDHKSDIKSLKLTVSDLLMLSCQYIQKGVLLSQSPIQSQSLISLLKTSLSQTLTHFPALAGRLSTDTDGHVHILCNDAGVDFIHAKADYLSVNHIIAPLVDIHPCFKQFFALDTTLSYAGHYKPIAAVQVTELSDGLFIGFTVSHAAVDGTSLWHFFNTFAEVTKGVKSISNSPTFCRKNVFNSPVTLPSPAGGPVSTFSGDQPLREKIFHFSREAISKLKFRANNSKVLESDGAANQISSFQSLSAQLWRAVTRARKLEESRTTTFRMPVNCRHRVEPKVDPLYFGNLIQNIPTVVSAGDLLSNDLGWSADLLHKNVVAHVDSTVRRGVADWESNPRVFPLGNFDGTTILMGSAPRLPMYNNDFGWGRPLAIRSGTSNKFDGKVSAFPGRDGDGSVDLELALLPQTMAGIELDAEFMQYVS